MTTTRVRSAAACLVAITAALMLAACGTPHPSSAPARATTLPAASNDDCPASGGASGGALTGIGATISAFRSAHKQSAAAADQFGATIHGGPNDGLASLTATCFSGRVELVTQHLATAQTAAQLKAGLASFGIAPADAQVQADTTPGGCEVIVYTSAALSADPLDPSGTFYVQFTTPESLAYDPATIATVLYNIAVLPAC